MSCRLRCLFALPGEFSFGLQPMLEFLPIRASGLNPDLVGAIRDFVMRQKRRGIIHRRKSWIKITTKTIRRPVELVHGKNRPLRGLSPCGFRRRPAPGDFEWFAATCGTRRLSRTNTRAILIPLRRRARLALVRSRFCATIVVWLRIRSDDRQQAGNNDYGC
jgi:hypothetical protein